jgi:hypothetical protein
MMPTRHHERTRSSPSCGRSRDADRLSESSSNQEDGDAPAFGAGRSTGGRSVQRMPKVGEDGRVPQFDVVPGPWVLTQIPPAVLLPE